MFDFFVGTSIGGLICLVFAMKKYSAREMLCMMLGLSKNSIFAGGISKNLTNIFLHQIVYNETQIQQFLQKICLNQRNRQESLSHPQKTLDFMITTCTYSSFPNQGEITPHIFYKYTNQQNQQKVIQKRLLQIKIKDDGSLEFQQKSQVFGNVQFWKILRATSAAFPYFKPVIINQQRFFDGGFMFNTPNMLACKFLEQKGIKSENIYMLSIGLEKPNPFDNDRFNLKEVQKQMSDLLNKNSMLYSARKKNFIGESMNNITHYCNEATSYFLGPNVIRLQPLQKLQVDLNKTDYASMCKMLRIAQQTILTVDLNEVINLFDLQGHKHENGISIQRHFPRSILYEDQGSYRKLNEMFDQNGQCELTPQKIEEFQQIFLNFKFPEELDKSEKRYNRPFCLSIHNMSFLLTEALIYGHEKSIKKFNQQDGFDRLQSNYNWNRYHIAMANDEVISVHLINQYYLQKCLTEVVIPISDHYLRITLNDAIHHEQINIALQKIKQKISDEKCNYSKLVYWKNKTARQFIFDYSSQEIKRYMKRFAKYLRDKNLQFNWGLGVEADRMFYLELIQENLKQCLLLMTI